MGKTKSSFVPGPLGLEGERQEQGRTEQAQAVPQADTAHGKVSLMPPNRQWAQGLEAASYVCASEEASGIATAAGGF